jgi:membrane dipeptidase
MRNSLDRRAILFGAAVGAAALAMPASGVLSANTRRLKNATIINALGGFGNPNAENSTEEEVAAHFLDPRGIADARTAGLTAVNFTLGHVFGEGDPFEESVADIAWMDAAIRARSGGLLRVYSVADIEEARKSRRLGVIYGFQNTEMLGEDAARVDIFADLGVRVFQLTYNLRNSVGDGALVPENRGLTDFGREVVAKLNARKLLVDLSHAGEQTTLDAIAASTAPIAISHTGCRALADHPRNKTDAELRALADKGGVVGVYFMPYLTPGRQQMADDIVLHIEHAVDICGEDHVGIGTDGSVSGIDDMEGYRRRLKEDVENRKKLGVGAPGETADIVLFAPDLSGVDQFRKLADLLDARGHSEARIEKILGGNFMRLFGEVWDD